MEIRRLLSAAEFTFLKINPGERQFKDTRLMPGSIKKRSLIFLYFEDNKYLIYNYIYILQYCVNTYLTIFNCGDAYEMDYDLAHQIKPYFYASLLVVYFAFHKILIHFHVFLQNVLLKFDHLF